MAKLEFIYGAVMSGKTAELVKKISEDKNNILICKPDIDFGIKGENIISRNGTSCMAKVIISKDTDIINDISYEGIDTIFVDEAQFLTNKHVEGLRKATTYYNIDVYCYGIIKDFRGFLFEGAARLFELADVCRELSANCVFCNKLASFNIKLVGGEATLEGEKIYVGNKDEELYHPSCYNCFSKHLEIK